MSGIKIEDNSAEFLALLEGRLRAAETVIGDKMEGYAKKNLNEFEHHGKIGYVDTGRAKGSISNTAVNHTIYVGSNVEYFVYLEVGTGIYAADGRGRKTPWMYVDSKGEKHWTRGLMPSHSLQRSISEHVDEYRNIVIDALKGK